MKETDYVYPVHSESHAGYLHFGLEVRDYIAIQAMVGILANSRVLPSGREQAIADLAYKQADAMIERSEAHE